MAKESAKTSFKRAYQRANAEKPISLADFTDTLINDIRQRLRLGQFGFDRLHPATYLNQARWQDELPPPQAVQSGQVSAKKPSFTEMNQAPWNTPEGWEETF